MRNLSMKELESKTETNESRRDFLKKAAYVPPVIITMTALPTQYAYGSGSGPVLTPGPLE